MLTDADNCFNILAVSISSKLLMSFLRLSTFLLKNCILKYIRFGIYV